MTTKWPSLALDDVARLEYGTRVTRKKDGGTIYPVYGGGGATFHLDEWNREDCYIISRFAMSRECVRFVPGRFFLNDSGLTVSTRDSNSLTQEFLDIFLLAKSGDIFDLSRGTAQRNLDVPAFRMLEVPLPPLDEQKRIVAKLDAAQQQFDRLNTNLEHQLSQLTDFDSALLSEMLGNPCQTDEPAMTTKWPMVRLGDFVGINPQKSEARKLLNPDDFVSFIPMEDLGVRCGVVTPIKQRRFGDVQSSYTYFRDGDVLLAKITPCFENGKLGIAQNLVNGVGFGSSEYLVIRPSDLLLSEYVYYAISRNEFIDQGKRVMTGSVGHKRVPKDYVSELQIPLPPLDEQKRIVAKLDEASQTSSLLRSNIIGRKKSASELQSSILAAAFAGAL